MEEGAVADVLEQVRHVGERCLPDPLAALAAHLRQAGDSAVLTAGHGDECVATDSAAADGTLGDSGGTVVGAPAAEVRGSLGGKHVERQRGREGALELDVRLQYAAQRGEQPACGQFTTGRHEQTALAVTLADDARGIVGAVQDFPDLSFDERGLVLDHDDLLEAFGELLDLLAHDGVAHSDAKETDPGAVQCGIIDAEVCQSLTDGVESCTGGGDTDLRTGGVDLDHIEVVGSSVRVHKIPSRAVQIGLGDDTVRRRGHLTLLVDEGLALELHFRNHDVEVRDAAVDRPGTVCDVGDDLQRYDATGDTRESNGVHTHRDDLFGIAWEENRHAHRGKRALADGRNRGGLRRGVVAHQEDDAALGVHAVHVGVANGVGSAVDAGALAVPDAGHAVVGRGSGREIRLASPYRRGGELLVEARDEGDVVLGENLGHAVKHLVDATEGAALVTGDEGGNTLTCPNVANVLLDEAACNCLNTGQQHRSRSRPVPIIEVIGLGLGYARHQFSHRGPPFRLQCISTTVHFQQPRNSICSDDRGRGM